MTKINQARAVIFDYDDTLVQTMASKWDALRETGKRYYGLKISDEHIKKYWGRPYLEMLDGVLMSADSIANLQRNYENTTIEFPMKPHDGAREVVGQLLGRYKIGIVTAGGKKVVFDDLTLLDFPIDKLFYVQTSEDTNIHKPDPAVFDPILSHLAGQNIAKTEVIYVGDALMDLQAAEAAGLRFIGVTTGRVTKEEFRQAGATSIIGTLRELPKLL